jgi:hypothetical protein
MKAKLERINERLIELRDQAHDDELSDEIDNAILHVEAAIDRIVQMEEEEEGHLSETERRAAIALADELLDAMRP